MNKIHVLKQMQYRFAVIYETLSIRKNQQLWRSFICSELDCIHEYENIIHNVETAMVLTSIRFTHSMNKTNKGQCNLFPPIARVSPFHYLILNAITILDILRKAKQSAP